MSAGFSPGLLDYQAHSLSFTSYKGEESPGITAQCHPGPRRGFLLPSLSLPSSAADPFGKMVLTKIPICPRMQSRPPAMLKPRPYMQSRWGTDCQYSISPRAPFPLRYFTGVSFSTRIRIKRTSYKFKVVFPSPFPFSDAFALH